MRQMWNVVAISLTAIIDCRKAPFSYANGSTQFSPIFL